MIRLIKKYLRPILRIIRKHRINKEKALYVNIHHDVSSIDKSKVADMRKYGFSLSESAVYNLKKNDYREYVNTYESYKPRMLDSQYFAVSDDKYLFSLVFGNYVNIPAVYALIQNGQVVSLGKKELNNDNLFDFFVENKGGVVKDRGGCDGFDVFVFDCDDGRLTYKNEIVDKRRFIEIVSNLKNGMVQEKLTQSEFENSIFPYSINTIRIITMRKKDSFEHEIVAALQRIGTQRSAPVDNFNQGGGSALIDIKTGTLSSMTCIDSFDSDNNRIYYDVHPDNNTQIKGLEIPGWEKIKSDITDLTKKLPFFEYIAWDVVHQDDGISVVETNMKSSLNVFQVHGGMRNSLIGEKYREKGFLEKF